MSSFFPDNLPYFLSDSTSVMYKTHWNYIKYLNTSFLGINIKIKIKVSSYLDPEKTKRFEKLASITKQNIESEIHACEQETSYSSVVAPWIPVKCYYRIYYLESIFLYYLLGSEAGFKNGGHTKVRGSIRKIIEEGVINFEGLNPDIFSEIDNWENASSFTTTSGSNISGNYFQHPDCRHSIRKKIAEYIKIDWMQKKGIINFRKKVNKDLRDIELKPKKFTIFDYFYWMRIKANYRDVDFLDFENEVSARDSFEYIKEFVGATESYASALENAIITLKQSRSITN